MTFPECTVQQMSAPVLWGFLHFQVQSPVRKSHCYIFHCHHLIKPLSIQQICCCHFSTLALKFCQHYDQVQRCEWSLQQLQYKDAMVKLKKQIKLAVTTLLLCLFSLTKRKSISFCFLFYLIIASFVLSLYLWSFLIQRCTLITRSNVFDSIKS